MFTNKYALLVLINLPLLLIGVISAITNYKTGRISKQRCVIQVAFWLSVAVGLVFVEPLYNALVSRHLTESAPLSIFDVLLLTAVLFCLFLIKQANEKMALLSKKIARIHESLVISQAERPRHDK